MRHLSPQKNLVYLQVELASHTLCGVLQLDLGVYQGHTPQAAQVWCVTSKVYINKIYC